MDELEHAQTLNRLSMLMMVISLGCLALTVIYGRSRRTRYSYIDVSTAS